jgi:hypothetical protein
VLFLQPFFYSLAISNASDFFDRIRMSKYARHHEIEKQNPPHDIPRAGWLCEFDGAINFRPVLRRPPEPAAVTGH